jgi:hypothetical protein
VEASTQSDINEPLVIKFSKMTRRWYCWKIKELNKLQPLPVNMTQYRDSKQPEYANMGPLCLFEETVLNNGGSAPKVDLDRGYGIYRSMKSSSRHDPMQKTKSRLRRTLQMLDTERQPGYHPDGPEVSSLLNSVLAEAQLNDLTSCLGGLTVSLSEFSSLILLTCRCKLPGMN